MPVAIKGNLKLEVDELGIEARVTIAPDADGADISEETVKTLLAEKGVKEGIDAEGIGRAFRTLARKREPLSFPAARGAPPVPPEAEAFTFEPMAVSEAQKGAAAAVLPRAPQPEIFDVREEKIKKEKKVLKKAALPFLPPKEEVETVWEKKIVKERVEIDPAVIETGYVSKDAVVARAKPAKAGKEGRSIYGRLVPAPRPSKQAFHFGGGLKKAGNEVRAEVSGFLRRGNTWADIVPYRDNEVALAVDGATCFLSFHPGDKGAPATDVSSILEEARKLGFTGEKILPAAEIEKMLAAAIASGKPIEKQSISPTEEGRASVTVSPDKLRATMDLHKGRGAGRKLTLAEVSEAIRKSGVRGFNAETVKKDILAFYNGPQAELAGYTLVTGQAPEKGTDGKLEWLTGFLKKEDAERIRLQCAGNASRVTGIQSLAELPLERVESVALVEAGAEVLRIVPPTAGKAGIDVFKVVLPGIKGIEPGVKVLENFKRQKDIVVASIAGLLEKGTAGGVVALRIRPHADAVLEIAVSEDRMKGFLSYRPAEGTGKVSSPDEVKAAIEKAGIIQGVKSDALLDVLDSIARNVAVPRMPIAEGQSPRGGAGRTTVLHVRTAPEKKVSMRQDGSADFKNLDAITQVTRGQLLATTMLSGQPGQPGWDVTGKAISAETKEDQTVEAGKNVRAAQGPDGKVDYFAESDGELSFERSTLEVRELHTVAGNVDLASGNVKFMGKVQIKGSVISGFTVVAGDDVVIGEVVQAAFVSSEGSILIGQGIKGEGRAVLRARKEIRASFVEQASLLAMGNITMKSASLRCQIKCNGKLILESEKGNLMGGCARARMGATVQNLGSSGGAHTELSFGQDYVVRDQIEKEEKELEALKHRIAELDSRMAKLERAGPREKQALGTVREEKVRELKALEKRSIRLLGLRDKFEEHFPAEVVVRGTMFPGAVVESHGRLFEVKVEKSGIALYFDPAQGRILEKQSK